MAKLLPLIHNELALVDQFIALLRKEQTALQQGDAMALPAIAKDKNGLVEGLNTAARGRNAWLEKKGLPADKEGVSRWLAANPHEKAVAEAWQKLMRLANEAHQLHVQNGQLITIRLQATNEALAVLNQESQRNALYGPNGQAAAVTGYRIIDSA